MKNNFTKFRLVLFLLLILMQIGFNRTVNAQWTPSNGVGGGFVWCITYTGSNLFIGTQGYGIFKSTDNGNTWTPSDSGLKNSSIFSLTTAGQNIIAGTKAGIYYSSNSGNSWNVGDTTLITPIKWVYALAVGSNGNVYAGTKYHNANDPKTTFYSGNNGVTWQITPVNPVNSGTGVEVYSLYQFNGNLFAGTNHGVFKTNDGGFTWIQVTTGDLGNNKSVYSLTPLGTKLLAGTYQNGIFWSSDGGSSFFAQNTNIFTGFPIYSMTTLGSTVYAASFGYSIYKANDGNSLNWNFTLCQGLPDKYICALATIGSSMISGSFYSALYKSVDSSNNWSYLSNGITGTTLSDIANNGTNLFASTVGCGIFLSSDNGNNWAPSNSGLVSAFVYSLTSYSINMFAGTSQGIYLTTNNGTSWFLAGLLNKKISCMATVNSSLLAAESVADTSGKLYISNDGGQTWPMVFSSAKPITSFTNLGTTLFIGQQGAGVYTSINGGTIWTPVNTGLTNLNVHSLTSLGASTLVAGTEQGAFVSTDMGNSWSPSGSSSIIVNGLTNDGTNIISATNSGIFVSNNMGASWLLRNDGLYSDTVSNCLLIANNNVFAGMSPVIPRSDQVTSLIWKRGLSNLVIGIKNISSEIPDRFMLMQNYPNPFNPSTVIRWQIKEGALVTLKVFDITGREIGTYVNQKLKPGLYETTIDASGLSSGVYFYRLQAGNFIDTKKMIFLK